MHKLATFSYDTLDHIINGELDHITDMVGSLSKEAQQAEIPDADEREQRPDSDFGLILHHPKQGTMRKFAKFTPEVTELNINLLSRKKDQLPDQIVKVAAANLGRAAKDYGLTVPENLEQFVGESFVNNNVDVSDIEKTAEYEPFSEENGSDHYALETVSKYPIDTEPQIKEASQYFKLHHRIFDMHEKKEYADNLYKRAQELDVDITDSMAYKYATLMTDKVNPDFENHIKARKSYVADNQPEKKGVYDDLLEKKSDLGPQKLAQALSEVDKTTGTWSSWGKGLADPLMATHPMQKQAGCHVDGKHVTPEMLRALDNGDITAIAGNSSVRELKSPSGPEFLKKLPRPVRHEILKLIEQQ